ncbi:hypothetical protein EON64_21095, partial [archaeon]
MSSSGDSGGRPLFRSSLEALLLDPHRCVLAKLQPQLGVPNQVLNLISFIESHIDSPSLFRQRASVRQVQELQRSLEAEQGVPAYT